MENFIILVVLTVFIIAAHDIVKTICNRECIGCKRLAKLEKDVFEIKEQILLNGYFDKSIFENIDEKLDQLINEVQNG